MSLLKKCQLQFKLDPNEKVVVSVHLDLPAKAFITIAGAVKSGSLRIKVVDDKGTVHADIRLTAVGTSGVRYFDRFDPPSGPFNLQLHGQTKKAVHSSASLLAMTRPYPFL